VADEHRPDWVIRLSDQPTYAPGGHEGVANRLLVGRAMQGTEQVSIWHGELAPDGRADPHVHAASEQIYIVVGGTIEVGVEDETANLTRSDTAFIPAGATHLLVNRGLEAAQVLVISTPALR
jgi:mannose-6-phosphate isomerase-like protein (cupin superfamily)